MIKKTQQIKDKSCSNIFVAVDAEKHVTNLKQNVLILNHGIGIKGSINSPGGMIGSQFL